MVNMSDNSIKEKEKELINKKSEEVEIKESLLEDIMEDDDQMTVRQKYTSLKDKYNYLRRISLIIKEFVGLIILCVAYLYYYLSLEKCFKGQENCSLLVDWQFAKIYQELKSCFITVFFIELLFYNLLSKFHLIHFILVFSYFYK